MAMTMNIGEDRHCWPQMRSLEDGKIMVHSKRGRDDCSRVYPFPLVQAFVRFLSPSVSEAEGGGIKLSQLTRRSCSHDLQITGQWVSM